MLLDATWAENKVARNLQIAMATFGILALELALIRWMSGQIRVFAYFNNLILIGCFLGMGLGLVLGRRWPGLVHLALPALALLSLPLAFSASWGLIHIPFPDPAVFLWGASSGGLGARNFFFGLFSTLILFGAVVAVFLFAGSAVGYLFSRVEGSGLRGYSADLLGSLAGVLTVSITTALGTTPPVWLLLGGLPFLLLSRRLVSAVSFVVVVTLGWMSIEGATYSPYNRIDLEKGRFGYTLSVNRDFHQYMHDFSKPDELDPVRSEVRQIYDIPFVIAQSKGRALIVGAGTGNDVQAALRNGFQHVTSVDIDGGIMDIGRRLHPEHPYGDPRVVPVVNDARAFFEQFKGDAFDVITYGFVDSHAMFSALSTLRLDNYIYTEEGIRAAWKHLTPGGHLTVALSLVGGPWIKERLYWTMARATGTRPVLCAHGVHGGATFLAIRDPSKVDLRKIANWPLSQGSSPGNTLTTSDDWPFLYIRPGVIPWGYILVLCCVLVFAVLVSRSVFGTRDFSSFDTGLFLMGAGFLLIETRGVTSLSLLFGSTWIVNAAVFSGVLVMALVANVIVEKRGPMNLTLPFLLLMSAVLLLWLVDTASLNRFPLEARWLLGALLNGLPVGFAGIIVSTMLARSRNLPASLGSNLLGSVVGGTLEYLSMVVGLRALALMALSLYLGAFLLYLRAPKKGVATA